MDEKPDQIIGHIEAQRHELGRNLNELETRVRQTTDWRTYYDRNPMLMMGAALGGGLLVGSMIGSKSSGRSSSYSRKKSSSLSSSAMGLASAGAGGAAASSWSRPSRSNSSSHSMSQQMGEISRTLEHVKTALISFGIAKAKEFLSQAVPGLDQHLNDAAQKHQPGQGSSQPAQHFADSGAFAQESGGHQPSGSTNWESDMNRSSGQFNASGQQSGSADYYAGNRGAESGQTGEGDRVPTHQY